MWSFRDFRRYRDRSRSSRYIFFSRCGYDISRHPVPECATTSSDFSLPRVVRRTPTRLQHKDDGNDPDLSLSGRSEDANERMTAAEDAATKIRHRCHNVMTRLSNLLRVRVYAVAVESSFAGSGKDGERGEEV